MTAYLVLDFSVHDLAGFMRYVRKIPAHIARHNGRYLVRGEPATPVEGGWAPERMVILEFASRQDAEAFLSDPDIQPLFAVRHRTTTSRLILVDGCD